jgi:hypothetical protein
VQSRGTALRTPNSSSMPRVLRLRGWTNLRRRLPKDGQLLRETLDEPSQRPGITIEWLQHNREEDKGDDVKASKMTARELSSAEHHKDDFRVVRSSNGKKCRDLIWGEMRGISARELRVAHSLKADAVHRFGMRSGWKVSNRPRTPPAGIPALETAGASHGRTRRAGAPLPAQAPHLA